MQRASRGIITMLALLVAAVCVGCGPVASGTSAPSPTPTTPPPPDISPFPTATALVAPVAATSTPGGLGQYGRNNICYVPGMGSFHRLWAFYSDLVWQEDNWQEAQMMASCQNCSVCLRNCPTGAITSERFLLHAERCITFHNEQPGDVPFPTWMDPCWHNCLIGCSYCQNVCPQNKDFWHRVERGAEFSDRQGDLERPVVIRLTPRCMSEAR